MEIISQCYSQDCYKMTNTFNVFTFILNYYDFFILFYLRPFVKIKAVMFSFILGE